MHIPIKELRFRRFFRKCVKVQGHRSWAIAMWLLAGALDSLIQETEEEREKGIGLAILMFMSLHQTIIDGGAWHNSWDLSLAADFPWTEVNHPDQDGGLGVSSKFTPLASQELRSVVASYRKDMKAVAESTGTPSKTTTTKPPLKKPPPLPTKKPPPHKN